MQFNPTGRDAEVPVPPLLAQQPAAPGQGGVQHGGARLPRIRDGPAVLDGVGAEAEGFGREDPHVGRGVGM